MSIPSPERQAALAIKIAHDVYTGGCIDCGAPGVEMHEILGRTMRPILGSTVCILGVTLAPLCKKHHDSWPKLSVEEQLWRLQDIMISRSPNCYALTVGQRDQLIALRARAAVCK